MGDVSGMDKEALRSAHTSAPELRGEVLSGPERRRRWSTEEKLRVLAQSMAPGSSPSLACRMHGISICKIRILNISTGSWAGRPPFGPVGPLQYSGQWRPEAHEVDQPGKLHQRIVGLGQSVISIIKIEKSRLSYHRTLPPRCPIESGREAQGQGFSRCPSAPRGVTCRGRMTRP